MGSCASNFLRPPAGDHRLVKQQLNNSVHATVTCLPSELSALVTDYTPVLSKLYVIGGSTSKNVTSASVEFWDTRHRRWQSGAPMSAARQEHVAVELNSRLYVMGGWVESTGDLCHTTESYDTRTDMWVKRADVLRPRCGASACAVRSQIYVLNGLDPNTGYRTEVDRYDAATNEWSTSINRCETAASHRATAGLRDDTIVVAGGCDNRGSTTMSVTSTVDCYDTVSDQWLTPPPPLQVSRAASGAVRLDDGRMLVAGGFRVDESVFSLPEVVEAYDPRASTPRWQTLSPLKIKCSAPTVVLVNGNVYCLGGLSQFSEQTPMPVQQYDPRADRWTILTDVVMNRVLVAAAVLPCT